MIFLMDPEALQFPVLALAQDGSIVPVDSLATLRQCNATAFWRNHYYDGMVIIDADEKTWHVTQALPILPAGTVGRAMARLVNGKVQVHLVLEPDTGPDGLAMAKSRVSRWMDRDGDFWEASTDLDEWKARVNACPTMHVLVELFR